MVVDPDPNSVRVNSGVPYLDLHPLVHYLTPVSLIFSIEQTTPREAIWSRNSIGGSTKMLKNNKIKRNNTVSDQNLKETRRSSFACSCSCRVSCRVPEPGILAGYERCPRSRRQGFTELSRLILIADRRGCSGLCFPRTASRKMLLRLCCLAFLLVVRARFVLSSSLFRFPSSWLQVALLTNPAGSYFSTVQLLHARRFFYFTSSFCGNLGLLLRGGGHAERGAAALAGFVALESRSRST